MKVCIFNFKNLFWIKHKKKKKKVENQNFESSVSGRVTRFYSKPTVPTMRIGSVWC